MGRLWRVLDRVDSFLSWLERLAHIQWIKWGVSFMTFYLFHLWAVFAEKPFIDRVALALGVAAAVTILFTFLPLLLRRLISPFLKPRFLLKRWEQIANLTNAKLQQKVLETVCEIRESLEQYRREEHLQNSAPMFPQGASTFTKDLLHRQHFQETIERSNHFMANYKRQFQVDVILLRDELRKRLPHAQQDTLHYIEQLYENPVNPLGVETIVLDLERLAKRLPTPT